MTEQTEDRIIKFMGKVNRRMPQLFPRNRGSFEDGEFAILNFDVYEKLQGVIEPNTYGSMTIKGWNFDPSYTFDAEYIILAKHVGTDPKFGDQWECLMCTENINLKDTWQQKIFLEAFLNDNQIQKLFETFDNPMEVIENGDKEKLKQVHGVGDYIADLILKKYEANKDYTEAYIELSAYGMNPNMIKKLCDKYGSAHVLVEKIKLNPYILVDQVKGIGFKTIDEMALHSGIPKFSTVRLEAYITYILNEGAQQGYSWITSGVLVDKIELELDAFPIETIIEVVNQMKSDKIIFDGEIGVIALQRYRQMEEDIRDELIRIRDSGNNFDFEGWEDKVKQAELLNGYPYTEEQKKAIKVVLDNQVSVITGGAGCVDGDTEYFNGAEWVKISEYVEGDSVLQFNEDRSANLTKPLRYIKEKEETLYKMKNKSGSINQVLSNDHNIAYVTSGGNLKKQKANDFFESQLNSKLGTKKYFLSHFDYGGSGINLSNDWIRIMVAVFADGCYDARRGVDTESFKKCRLTFKKERKIKRIRMLLNRVNVVYTERKITNGNTNFYFETPFRGKQYPKHWYRATKKQLETIGEEVTLWDGHLTNQGNRLFFSTIKTDADFIQFVMASTGHVATISTLDRRIEYLERGLKKVHVDYVVNISKNRNMLLTIKGKTADGKTKIIPYTSHDGYKYCFTVPSGYLVLRRNDRIFVTGNCGKTTTVLGALKALGDISFVQCALSGCASARLEEATGYSAATIHRTLGFNPMGGGEVFAHNKDNPLNTDAGVLDEVSMVGGLLFLNLLKAIPNGAKFIMIGDVNQLPAIGALNVANDIIDSPHVAVGWLNQIHRQSAKSGVIVDAHKIKNGEQITEKGFVGKETRGELQDFELDIHEGTDLTVRKAIEHFKEKLSTCKDIMDVQLIAPMRMRGETSVYNLNLLAQEIYNPSHIDKPEAYVSLDKDKGYTLRKGDKVINVKNNYKMPLAFSDGHGSYFINRENGEPITTQVFNGYIGTIIDVINNDIVIHIPLMDETIMVPSKHWKTAKAIELAYAITVHKCQGQTIPYPICVLDSSHYRMLSKELLYTALTRSSKHCTLVAENKALQKAISTTSVRDKQTFLVDLLEEDYQNKLEEGV